MRKALGLIFSAASAFALAPVPARAEDKPVEVAYYYTVRWGFQEEFERLFLKNHLPVLNDDKKNGRILDVKLFKPTFHGEGRADWTFLVVIRYPSWQALGVPRDEAVVKRLFPDQETFKREEARRFEILEAHWDVPLTPFSPPK
jgi:hypothetical protein